ncbi:MAG: A/G-specific adenine glycosylase, partial [Bacteroidota bacterium]
MSIGQAIVDWYEKNGRDLPWRETRDPYPIWISEIILQQTRIATGIAYYHRFLERFPDLPTLAAAEQDEVLKYWEGLGYYSRARNLHAAAQQLMNEYDGVFPDHYSELLKLKGIGAYTARAIGSFAFDNPTGVIDCNVLRVMSRVLNDFSPIDVPATRKQFQQIIDKWVAEVPSPPFNQGIMDIGSTICTPTKPACLICPLLSHCEGYQQGSLHLLPRKAKKLKRKDRYFHFYLI